MNVECLVSGGSGRGQLLADRELRLIACWRLLILHVVLPLDFDVFLSEPLFRDDYLLDYLKDKTAEMYVFRQIRLKIFGDVPHFEVPVIHKHLELEFLDINQGRDLLFFGRFAKIGPLNWLLLNVQHVIERKLLREVTQAHFLVFFKGTGKRKSLELSCSEDYEATS